MSTSFRPNVRTYIAVGTITAYSAVKFSTDNKHVTLAGAGDKAIGISQNDASVADGKPIEVAMPGGGGKWQVNTTLAAPGPFECKSDGSGFAVKANDTDWVVATVYDGASSGDIKEVYVNPHYAGATTS